MEMVEQVGGLPEVAAGVESGFPGFAGPAAVAAPTRSDRAAASAERRSCQEGR